MSANDERDQAIASVHRLIWRIVNRHVRHVKGDADDAYQECVAILCQRWPHYDPARAKFTTFTMNVCRRHLRQMYILGRLGGGAVRVSRAGYEQGHRVQVASLNVMRDKFDFDVQAKVQKPVSTPETFVATAEELVGRSLSETERRILVSRFVDKCEFKDIAKNCGLPNRQRAQYILNKFAAEARLHREATEGVQ